MEVAYFSATDPAVVIQRVTATEAMWDAGKKILTGSGAIAVSSGENQLIGEGFDFALGTSLLHIHRNFTMTNPEVRLTSDRATVELVVERGSEKVKFRDVRRCEATGNLQVHIQPGARNKYPLNTPRRTSRFTTVKPR